MAGRLKVEHIAITHDLAGLKLAEGTRGVRVTIEGRTGSSLSYVLGPTAVTWLADHLANPQADPLYLEDISLAALLTNA